MKASYPVQLLADHTCGMIRALGLRNTPSKPWAFTWEPASKVEYIT